MLVEAFGKENIKCKWGNEHDFVGMRFVYNRDGTVSISMAGMIQSALDDMGIKGNECAKIPAGNNLFL